MKKLKVLFLTDFFYPIGSPSANCAKDVGVELQNNGHEVYFLTFKGATNDKNKQNYNFCLESIKPRFSLWLRQYSEKISNNFLKSIIYKGSIYLHRVKRLITMKDYPLMSKSFANRYTSRAISIIEKNQIDLVIGIYNPSESFFAIEQIKKKFPKLPCFIYAFDSMSNVEGTKYMSTELKEKKGWEKEKKFFKSPDYLFFMECHREFYSNSRYQMFQNKFVFLDIPLYVPEIYNEIRQEYAIKKQKKRIMYAGSLDYKKRNPEKMLEIFEYLLELDSEIQIVFYVNMTCFDLLLKFKEKHSKRVLVNTFIDDESLRIEELKTDLLVSLGVHSDAISSKIFRYFSTGNKSIHLYNYDKEPVLKYYELYNNGFCISEEEDSKSIAYKIRNFLNAADNKVDETIFNDNRPTYAAAYFEKLYSEVINNVRK